MKIVKALYFLLWSKISYILYFLPEGEIDKLGQLT